MKKYTVVVDCGIPYEEKVPSKKLMAKLKSIGKQSKDAPHCDVFVYRGKKDVTDSVFKKYHKKYK